MACSGTALPFLRVNKIKRFEVDLLDVLGFVRRLGHSVWDLLGRLQRTDTDARPNRSLYWLRYSDGNRMIRSERIFHKMKITGWSEATHCVATVRPEVVCRLPPYRGSIAGRGEGPSALLLWGPHHRRQSSWDMSLTSCPQWLWYRSYECVKLYFHFVSWCSDAA
jgi:hypothetical protein